MSYFENMFKKSNTFKTYVLSVNNFGEAVCYYLDKDGNPTKMCAGDMKEVIGCALKDADPRIRVISYGPGPGETPSPGSYGIWPHGNNRWAVLVATCNKKGVRAARTSAKLDFLLHRYDIPEIDRIDCYKYEITDLGRAADMELDKKSAKGTD